MNKRIYLTIDIECHNLNKRNLYIDGKYSGGVCGLEYVLQFATTYNIPINCFLDIPEANVYGEEYIREIIDLIHKYNQHVYLHLHPDYITFDHTKSFLWQYSYEEKKNILKSGFELYKKLLGHDAKFFRVGRYGADFEMYRAIDALGYKVTDLSYCSNCPKMCHLDKNVMEINNINTILCNQLIVPNTRYLGLKIKNRDVYINFDASDTTFNEFKRIISNTNLSELVLTMHSWNFIKKFFFCNNYLTINKYQKKKFIKMIEYARKNGFDFCDLSDTPPEIDINAIDESIDLCTGVKNFIPMIINNFIRFGEIARLNKKYFVVYAMFYSVLLVVLLLLFGFIV